MIKVSVIGTAGGAAFFLSFLIALFSGASFLIALLRGFISAVVFSALSAGIQILNDRFLSDGSSGQDILPGSPEAAKPVSGRVVNLRIADEDLREEDGAPSFSVGGETRILTKDDVQPYTQQNGKANADMIAGEIQRIKNKNAPSASEPAPSPKEVPLPTPEAAAALSEEGQGGGFTPVNLSKASFVSDEAAAQKEEAPEPPRTMGIGEAASSDDSSDPYSGGGISIDPSDEELDELPDIGGLGLMDDSASRSGQSEVIEDSDFASAGRSSAPVPSAQETSVAVSGDSAIMAEAIRTILSNE